MCSYFSSRLTDVEIVSPFFSFRKTSNCVRSITPLCFFVRLGLSQTDICLYRVPYGGDSGNTRCFLPIRGDSVIYANNASPPRCFGNSQDLINCPAYCSDSQQERGEFDSKGFYSLEFFYFQMRLTSAVSS